MQINLLKHLVCILLGITFLLFINVCTAKQRVESKPSQIYTEYSSLIKAIKKCGIDISDNIETKILEHIESGELAKLIKSPISNPALSWNFHDLVFLRNDLLFISYDDGEMYGGNLLVAISFLKGDKVSMEIIWNSAEE
ncbi:MAG: hypothetical protein SWH61_17835 [Thermodesulfobacteriota bacterium]|nr:hypothetical protein [Thermodesulfobacteriota bacterium]